MSIPGTPTNMYVQTANRQNLVSWDLSIGATEYIVQRSLDNVTFTTISTISGSPLATSYLDVAVTTGTQYYYKVAASNSSGVSNYTAAQSIIPYPTGELSLAAIRLQSQQRADRVNSKFVSLPEWNQYINKAMFELYDLLVTTYEDYYVADPVSFQVNGTQATYPLPDGSNTFINAQTGETFTPRPFYKLLGTDLSVNPINNAYVTVNKFNFIDRNKYIYPNSSSAIYGVYNLSYRIMGNQIKFIPTPSANQYVQLWYIPRLIELLQDTDTTDVGISGWVEYVIVRAAKYALDKEEADTTKLDQQILFLKQRIEETASNRDAGQPDTVSNTRGSFNGWSGNGYNGPLGGI